MKYDEAGREKLFKYDKIRESPSPFIKKQVKLLAEAEFAKVRLQDSPMWGSPESSMVP